MQKCQDLLAVQSAVNKGWDSEMSYIFTKNKYVILLPLCVFLSIKGILSPLTHRDTHLPGNMIDYESDVGGA